jgi:hypothetical protein
VIRTLAFAGYRSLRELRIAVGPLTAITGGNGTGKSNVYRALRLLVDAANGELARALAREGGMPSAMWAGEPAKKARSAEGKRISIGFADDVIAYELRLGLPQGTGTAFFLDPVVKEETALALLPPDPDRRRQPGARCADRYAHAGARARWRRPRGRAADCYTSCATAIAGDRLRGDGAVLPSLGA